MTRRRLIIEYDTVRAPRLVQRVVVQRVCGVVPPRRAGVGISAARSTTKVKPRRAGPLNTGRKSKRKQEEPQEKARRRSLEPGFLF